MNQELKVMGAAIQTPDLIILLNRFENINVSILDISNEIAFHINAIKQFPVPNFLNLEEKEAQPTDVLTHLEQQLNKLELSNTRLEEIFNHLKTII